MSEASREFLDGRTIASTATRERYELSVGSDTLQLRGSGDRAGVEKAPRVERWLRSGEMYVPGGDAAQVYAAVADLAGADDRYDQPPQRRTTE